MFSKCDLSVCPEENEYTVDDTCLILLLKGLCLKNQNRLHAAEDCFNKVYSRSVVLFTYSLHTCMSNHQ